MNNPIVNMDILVKGQPLGSITIRLSHDVFPAGVENFVGIAGGKTYRTVNKGIGRCGYVKETQRSYTNTKFYHFLHNNYIVGGDIYQNDGSSAGTIFDDEPIPAKFGKYYYPHDSKGLVSLVPFYDETSKKRFYDSTFMITLDSPKPSNTIKQLDEDQVVIGRVIRGLDVIDKINELIKPYAGRKYPDFVIGKSSSSSTTAQTR